jgi:hypothetical protein
MESEHSANLLSDTSSLQEEIQFSRLLTIGCLIICASGIGLLLWMVAFSEGLRLSVNESRDLERIASRMLGFESRLPELSSFEQMMFRLGGQDGETQDQIRLWYEEMVNEQPKTLDLFYLGILYGEAGLMDQLNRVIVDGEREGNSHALFRRLLRAAYLSGETSIAEAKELQARLAEEVPTNWFYFQLAQRLADQTGDRALRAHLQSQFYQLTDTPLLKWRLLLVGEIVLIGIGSILFLRFAFTRLTGKVSRRSGGFEERHIPWTFQEGTAVLVRGGALTIVLMGVMAILPFGPHILEDYGIAFLYLPSVILTSVLLCRPRKRSFLQVVGFRNVGQHVKYSVPLVVMVGTLGLVGDWFIVIVGDAFQSSVHWTEWFVPHLVWGSQMDLVKTAIEFVILAPIFEEFIFRGILFATLRKRFNFLPSMVASGLIFALAHGYGMIAFLTVLWSGCLWAWTYERTGSVIPGILAHAMNNGVVVYSLVAFFR